MFALKHIYNSRYNVTIYTNKQNKIAQKTEKIVQDPEKIGQISEKIGQISKKIGQISEKIDKNLTRLSHCYGLQIQKEGQIESLHLQKVNFNCNIRPQQQKQPPTNAIIK